MRGSHTNTPRELPIRNRLLCLGGRAGGAAAAGKLDLADIANMAEEIETLARSEKRELRHRLHALLVRLLKWQVQPSGRGTSWQLRIRGQRLRLHQHLAESPSLRRMLPEVITEAWPLALLRAIRKTKLDERLFPTACPWQAEQMLDDEFWSRPSRWWKFGCDLRWPWVMRLVV